MTRTSYPSDLTDEQWTLIKPLIPKPRPGGRPRSVDMRQVVNAILYINRSGRRMLGFGESDESALEHAARRILEIRRAADRLDAAA